MTQHTVVRHLSVGLAVCALGLFAAGLPAGFDYLRTPCVEGPCQGPQPSVEMVRRLQEAGLTADLYAAYSMAWILAFVSAHVLTAAVLVLRRPNERLALFVALALITFGVSNPPVLDALAVRHPAWWLPTAVIEYLGTTLFLVLFYVFPDGRFVPSWTRWAALLFAVVHVPLVFSAGQAFAGWPPAATFVFFVGMLGTPVYAQVYRYRFASTPALRQQTKWVVFGVTVALSGFLALLLVGTILWPAVGDDPLGFVVGTNLFYPLMAVIPVTISIAALRHRLWDIDPLISRTLAYGALTASVVTIYVLLIAAMGALFRTGGNLAVSLVATGVVAVLFQPLRERLQRAVDRLLYGRREDPYHVISRLDRDLDAALADLQRSRERLVTAREEERRRLRRDLHDGLGPVLAAQTLKAGAARSLLERDPAAANQLLADLETNLDTALRDIRQLVYNLRPPTLDDLGLVGAIKETVAQFTAPRGDAARELRVTVDAPERLPPLPAAVEVAAYRIAQEALNNVARHAHARHCTVRLALDDSAVLTVEVIDDGVGMLGSPAAGVGLVSMAERAAELGGACTVEPRPEGGTRVLARLPLPK